ncbi:MAG TPA: AMP-binding protein [Pseudomonadales bacterium]
MPRRASTRQPWYRKLRTGPADGARTLPTVHLALRQALASRPDRTLLSDETSSLTNGALLEAVEQRARALHARCGDDATVAVSLPNGIELAITYFACLRAGVRYLPLPAAPPAVLTALLDALRPSLVVGGPGRAGRFPGHRSVTADELADDVTEVQPPEPSADRPAHVLLTSGTESGTPKAVLTDHRGSMLSHRWRSALWPYDPARDVVGCNIFGVWDLVPALLAGVPAVMLRDETLRDPLALAAAVVRYGITRLMLTPTLLDACLESTETVTALARLRLIVLCGEAVTAPLMERAWQRLPDVQFANLYSLSECHDVAAGVLAPSRPITAGQVAPFAEVHVVDPEDRSRVLDTGEPGRVLIGGDALAVGYLDASATAAAFPTIRLGGREQRVYDTGDLGRLDDDGSLQILGRLDGRLKVRAAWVEPDTVTARLLEQPGVARAIALAEGADDGYPRLTAFVVPTAEAPADLIERLRTRLAQTLPPQSRPGRIELLDELPLLPSGKIDPAALRAGQRDARGPAPAARPVTDALEQSVLAAFRDVLQQPAARADDTFHDLGGDSLDAIVLCGRIHAFTGKPVRVRDLQRHSTAAKLARFLAARPAGRAAEGFALPMDRLPHAARRSSDAIRTIVVSGATGTLGVRLLRALLTRTPFEVVALVRSEGDEHARTRLHSLLPGDLPAARLTQLSADLTRPRLGLPDPLWRDLAERADAVLHLAARVDMFAGYESLAPVNVAGTRQLLELALAGGAAFLHLSSSAVLPLDPQQEGWDETHRGRRLLERLAPRLVHSDGYSQTKLAAEALVWQAAERGLPVTVARLPHLIGRGHPGRLANTLASLALLGVLPEGSWRWQLADVDAVCDRLIHALQEPAPDARLIHLAAAPVSDREIDAALSERRAISRLTLPALANRIAEAARSAPPNWSTRQRANVTTLAQLTREYGIRAALCIDEPLLISRRPLLGDAAALLLDSLPY